MLLDNLVDQAPGPETRYETTEAISLAFITALQLLPPRQRAVLVLRDVLGYRAGEIARMLVATLEGADLQALVGLLVDDVRLSMPPAMLEYSWLLAFGWLAGDDAGPALADHDQAFVRKLAERPLQGRAADALPCLKVATDGRSDPAGSVHDSIAVRSLSATCSQSSLPSSGEGRRSGTLWCSVNGLPPTPRSVMSPTIRASWSR